jgi:hypothetical protein
MNTSCSRSDTHTHTAGKTENHCHPPPQKDQQHNVQHSKSHSGEGKKNSTRFFPTQQRRLDS